MTMKSVLPEQVDAFDCGLERLSCTVQLPTSAGAQGCPMEGMYEPDINCCPLIFILVSVNGP
jgi:hypothetical protein